MGRNANYFHFFFEGVHIFTLNVYGVWITSKVSDHRYDTSANMPVLLHFSLSVKAVTLIFISGRDLDISSTHEGKTGNINGKTENFNCLLLIKINWIK